MGREGNLLVARGEVAAVVHEALVEVKRGGLLATAVGLAGELQIMTILELARVAVTRMGEAALASGSGGEGQGDRSGELHFA